MEMEHTQYSIEKKRHHASMGNYTSGIWYDLPRRPHSTDVLVSVLPHAEQ
jgi:hypothetical protein